jgi:hypothetical protein
LPIRRRHCWQKASFIAVGRADQHSLLKQIKVDEYLAKKQAMKCKNMGLKIARMEHSGTN